MKKIALSICDLASAFSAAYADTKLAVV
ncbi:OmpH family outer membrane protein, partial [Francisella tularensis subsp. holarctica]|nr:OmpH family outer membrane protein [Francisella tularensis subsp. holarctica]